MGKAKQKVILEFTTTATIRPEILDETYSSFTKNIADVDFKNSTLYINIDPVPEQSDTESVLVVSKKYFGNVVQNTPEKANFTNALKWCWRQPKGEFFFHLEDDWTLRTRVSVSEMIKKLSCMIENSKRFKIKTRMLDKYIAVNLRAYDFINDGRVCLSPGVFLSSWAKKAADILNPEHNPERQMRRNFGIGIDFLVESRALHHPHNRNSIIISDIGRPWLENSGHEKDKGMAFINWKKKG